MECQNNKCFHCDHVFDLTNLKLEGRRKICKHSNVDLTEIIAKCYCIDEHSLRIVVERNDSYVCAKCFNVFKSISVHQKKLDELSNSVKSSASNDFKNVTIKLDIETNSKKRNRECITPSKSGCTPRGKRSSTSQKSTSFNPSARKKNCNTSQFNTKTKQQEESAFLRHPRCYPDNNEVTRTKCQGTFAYMYHILPILSWQRNLFYGKWTVTFLK